LEFEIGIPIGYLKFPFIGKKSDKGGSLAAKK
jgi:hypothetical protein